MAILKTKEIAERSGVTVLILQRWDNNGALKAYCAPMLKVLFLDRSQCVHLELL